MKKPAFSILSTFLIPILLLVMMSRCSEEDLMVRPPEKQNGPNVDETKTTTTARTGSTGCATCDFVVNGYLTDGRELNVQPGQVICLDASQNYGRLVFRNIVGTHNQPVIIRNCGGVAKIYSDAAFGMKFEDSKDFKLVGDGNGPGTYGIKISTEKGFFLTMEHFTTDFEVAQVEIAGPSPNGLGDNAGFAGIGVKTSPYQDCELFTDPTRQAWIMRDVNIHDNYIHDTGGEGLYIGHGFYTGRKEAQCPSITYSHSIKGLKVYNNLIENTGNDGIQIKNANQNVDVYSNVIRNYGTHNVGAQNEGLFIGEGTVGKFHDNIVDTGTGNGCQVQGLGNLDLYNNLFINSGENGMYTTLGTYAVRLKGSYFNYFNNTIYNSKEIGFVFYNETGGVKRFSNNLVVLAGTLYKLGTEVEMKNNVLTNNVASVGFSNLLNKDLRLTSLSPAVDAGCDLSAFGVTTDLDGTARPSGLAFDAGCYER